MEQQDVNTQNRQALNAMLNDISGSDVGNALEIMNNEEPQDGYDADGDAPLSIPPDPRMAQQPDPRAQPRQDEELHDPDIAALFAGGGGDSVQTLQLQQQIAALQAQLTQLQQQNLQQQAQASVEYINEAEFEELLTSPAKLNAKLNAVAQEAAKRAVEQATAYTHGMINQQAQTTQAVETFYAKNPDLNAYRDDVRDIAGKLIKQNPNLNMAQLLEKTAKATRWYRKLPTPITGRRGGAQARGVSQLPQRRGGAAGSPQNNQGAMTVQEAEIDAMLKVAGI